LVDFGERVIHILSAYFVAFMLDNSIQLLKTAMVLKPLPKLLITAPNKKGFF
jgi:hypothetical protein